MKQHQLDSIARIFADRRMSRRQALRQSGAGIPTGALAMVGMTSLARAQDATPAPDTATLDEGIVAKTDFLFVQSFRQGSLVPITGEGPGGHTLTLEQGLGQTLFFSDRPNRVVGATPTADFLKGLGFSDTNPPNAALVMDAGLGDTDFAVLELFNPRYDVETSTATYDVHLLKEWEQTLGMSFSEQQAEQKYLHPEFGTAHLFIDGCEDGVVECVRPADPPFVAGEWSIVPYCYSPDEGCNPCVPPGAPNTFDGIREYWTGYCNLAFAEKCDGNCYAAWVGQTCDDC
jgi:hypothetical protein